MSEMKVGQMKDLILIEISNPEPDGRGGQIPGYVSMGQFWSKYKESTGHTMTDSTDHKETISFSDFTFRHTPQTAPIREMVPAKFRIRFLNKYWLPTGVTDIDSNGQRYMRVRTVGGDYQSAGDV